MARCVLEQVSQTVVFTRGLNEWRALCRIMYSLSVCSDGTTSAAPRSFRQNRPPARTLSSTECSPFLRPKVFFSVQTSRVARRLPFFFESSPSLTFPSRTETVSLLVARTEGKSEPPVPWKTGRVDGRRIHFQLPLCGIGKCHQNQSTASQRETLPWITKDSGKRQELWKQWPSLQGSSRNILFDSCVCSVQLQVRGLAGVWNFRFGDIPQAQGFFFKGTKQASARSTPSSMALNTVGTENSSSLTHGAETRGLEGNGDIDCRANDVSIKVDSETISTEKKKSSKSPQRKKKEKKVR